MALFDTSLLQGRVAIVTGGSRGIGRECCLALARSGCNVVIAAKSITSTPNLPGTIFTVKAECEKLGVKALAIQLDVRKEESVQACIDATIKEFGRVDVLINNASALWWQDIKDTPMKKYDLIHSVNARGSFMMAKYCLPHMSKNGFGRVICMSPPIVSKGYAGRTAYNHSKLGMTMVAMGISEEYAGQNITANTLWPATVIESQASINFKLGDPRKWRKATILADATLGIICEAGDFTGNMCLDDEYLEQYRGFTDKDMKVYRMDPNVKPARVLASVESEFKVKRGDIKKLRKDMDTLDSKL